MLNNGNFLTFGCEWEITNAEPCQNPNNRAKRRYMQEIDFTPHRESWGVDEWKRHLQAHGFDWVLVEYESTGHVAAEIISPPIADCAAARSDIARLLSFIEKSGGRGLRQFRFQRDVTNGLHVHVGINVQDASRNSPTEFWSKSKEYMQQRRRHYAGHPVGIMPLALAKDVISRWGSNWSLIQTMLPEKRRSSWAATSVTHVAEGGRSYDDFWALTAADDSDRAVAAAARECARLLGGKMAAVSMDTWARHGTIEFRQHASTTDSAKVWGWIELIDTVFKTSFHHRLSSQAPAAQTVVEETPAHLFRRVSRVGVLYSMARVSGGATTRELMAATGWDCQTIRARFSEIRSRLESRGLHGQVAVRQHSQQEYNHRYGSSNGQYDLGGYEILTQYEVTQPAQPALLPIDRRAPLTIWFGVSDALYEWWQRRIEQIR